MEMDNENRNYKERINSIILKTDEIREKIGIRKNFCAKNTKNKNENKNSERRYQMKIDKDIIWGGEERNELYASFLKPNYLFYDKIHNFILRIKNQKKNRMFDVLKNTNNQNKNSFIIVIIIFVIIRLFYKNKFIIISFNNLYIYQ